MNPQDKFITIEVVIFILVHLAIWIIGYSTGKLSHLISFLNLTVAISILAYWIIKQLNIQQHFFETREFIVLFFEVTVAASALYNIVSVSHYKAFTVFQYIVFGIDMTVLIAALIFMLAFKMTRIF